MFNPKENLLDQQLAVSGLEMQIFGIVAGIGAVASIVGGVSASNQASKTTDGLSKTLKNKKSIKEQAKKTNNITKKSLRLIRLIITAIVHMIGRQVLETISTTKLFRTTTSCKQLSSTNLL